MYINSSNRIKATQDGATLYKTRYNLTDYQPQKTFVKLLVKISVLPLIKTLNIEAGDNRSFASLRVKIDTNNNKLVCIDDYVRYKNVFYRVLSVTDNVIFGFLVLGLTESCDPYIVDDYGVSAGGFALCKILQTYMKLSDEQIFLYGNNYPVENKTGLLVYVILDSATTESGKAKNVYDPVLDVYNEVVHTVTYEYYDVCLTSYDRVAIRRKEEIYHALNSSIREEICRSLGGELSYIKNQTQQVSEAKGGQMLNRVISPVTAHYSKETIKPIEVIKQINLQDPLIS